MSDELLRYYNQELSFLREQGEAFANAHPKIATRLKLGPGEIEDPFVGRLLEGVALLTARIQYKHDEGLETMTTSLLDILYPHYRLPIPSLSIIEFEPINDLDCAQIIPKGTQLNLDIPDNKETICAFQTCYPVEIQPIKIQNITYKHDTPIKPSDQNITVKSCFNINIETINNLELNTLKPKKLRFYINSESRFANLFYELIKNHISEIVMTNEHYHGDGITLDSDALEFVGFADENNLLPYPPHTFQGYRLLTEFFHFPRKFLFFDIHLPSLSNTYQKDLHLNILLDRHEAELEKQIKKEFLSLNCTPIVNLFKKHGAPLKLNREITEHHIVSEDHATQSNLANLEIYRIEAINVASTQQGENISCLPYFGNKFNMLTTDKKIYWFPIVRKRWEIGEYDLPGTETFVVFSDMKNNNAKDNLSMPEQTMFDKSNHITLTPELLCTNRNITKHFSSVGKEIDFTLDEKYQSIVEGYKIKTNITKIKYRKRGEVSNIDLISHLSLNQICFDSPEATLNVLKELLTLYNYDNENDESMINKGLVSATTKRVTQRHPTSLKQGFCQGIELTLTVDEEHFPNNTLLIFASVINTFLRKASTINSFTRLILKSIQRGEIAKWKPELGSKTTI